MPGGNGTGPEGLGPKTGRGAGYCAGNSGPGYINLAPGRGFGFRHGSWGGYGGRGYRNWYYATGAPGWSRFTQGLPSWKKMPYYGSQFYEQEVTPQQEVGMLKEQSKFLKKELENIQKRIGTLEKESTNKDK